MYRKRILEEIFREARSQFAAVLITGPRQAGKTTFVVKEIPNAHYLSFDDPLNRSFAREDPNGFLDQFQEDPVILDEIQYVPHLLQYLKIRIDEDRSPGKWILTGSQQFHLMKNVSESLAGRVAILELAPFCLNELKTSKLHSLDGILWTGLFPEPSLAPSKRDLWIKSYIQTYLERDVRQLDNIQNLEAFELFVSLCAGHHGQEFHPSRLAGECGVSQPTIKSWRKVLEATYMGLILKPYYRNFGKRLIKTGKFYFSDPGLVCYLTRQPSSKALLSGNMGGALLEGLMVTEVWKIFLNHGKRPEIYFWRSHDGLEVDLLIPARGKLWPVEIKLTSTPSPQHFRNIDRLKRLASNEISDTGIVVCRSQKETKMPHGNLVLPWNEFSNWVSANLL